MKSLNEINKTDKKPKLHWTIDDLRQHGHYIVKLLLAEEPEVVTVRKINYGKKSWTYPVSGNITMLKLPGGEYMEIYPGELEAIKKIHTLVWEREGYIKKEE